jgi:pantoate--beta-alanine ligase
MKEARKECDFVTTSIFVNPKQFGPKEDLAKYPRNIERDLQLMKSVPVDYVFIPSEEEMYPKGFRTFVDLEDIDKTREGRARPGHFRGVATGALY